MANKRIKNMDNDAIIEIYNAYMGNAFNCYYRNDELFFKHNFFGRKKEIKEIKQSETYKKEDEMLFWGEDDFIETMSMNDAIRLIKEEYTDVLEEWIAKNGNKDYQ